MMLAMRPIMEMQDHMATQPCLPPAHFVPARLQASLFGIRAVPAAPAPKATANSEINDDAKLILFGATSIPTMQVNKTKDITLGFISFIKGFKLTE